jgi:hypothetical protein
MRKKYAFKTYLQAADVPMMQRPSFVKLRILMGSVGLIVAVFMLVWLITSFLGLTVSIVDVFGMEGLRIPAGVAIGGLLLAAVGFNKF